MKLESKRALPHDEGIKSIKRKNTQGILTNITDYQHVIQGQFPELEGATFTVLTEGWDSLAIDVDDALIFKFPRHAEAETRLRKEIRLLEIIRPRVSMHVPQMSLNEGPPVYSRHVKIGGAHLLSAQYAELPEAARTDLASKLALFYAELHEIDANLLTDAGASRLDSWPSAKIIRDKVLPLLPLELHPFALDTLKAWVDLPPDPVRQTYGFFDGHGWNMAFDHQSCELNGVFDFADSGFGMLHQEFIYSSFIHEDLTLRIIADYEVLTGRTIDRHRVEVLTGVYRLHELASAAGDPAHIPARLQNIEVWAQRKNRV